MRARFLGKLAMAVVLSVSLAACSTGRTADTRRGVTDAAWRTDRKTLLELYTIWFETGNMEIIKEIDEGLHDLLADVMQEELEEG